MCLRASAITEALCLPGARNDDLQTARSSSVKYKSIVRTAARSEAIFGDVRLSKGSAQQVDFDLSAGDLGLLHDLSLGARSRPCRLSLMSYCPRSTTVQVDAAESSITTSAR